jgi:hypothetical protein
MINDGNVRGSESNQTGCNNEQNNIQQFHNLTQNCHIYCILMSLRFLNAPNTSLLGTACVPMEALLQTAWLICLTENSMLLVLDRVMESSQWYIPVSM